jgi:glucose-6-phosphate isomerase
MVRFTGSRSEKKRLPESGTGGLEKAIAVLETKRRDKDHLLSFLPPPPKLAAECLKVAERLEKSSDTLVIVGIGGSSLSSRIFESIKNKNKLVVFEGIDPARISREISRIDFRYSCVNLVSKSGETLETLANAALVLNELKKQAGKKWKERVVLTAGPAEGRLQKWAEKEGIAILGIPDEVGGRFSVFTQVGLLPAAFLGLDVKKIMQGIDIGMKSGFLKRPGENPAAELSRMLLDAVESELSELVLWGYGETSHLLSLWLQQLWAESLGKKYSGGGQEKRWGVTPAALRGSEDQHSLLQLLTEGKHRPTVLFIRDSVRGAKLDQEERDFIGLKKSVSNTGMVQNALIEGTKKSLLEIGAKTYELSLGRAGEKEIAEAMTLLILSTLITAEVLSINPFGQPGVEEGKRITKSLLT